MDDGGATRGQGGEIITKIEKEVNDRREGAKGLQLYTTVNRLGVADSSAGDEMNR